MKQIINNPDSYPQLSFAEFNTLINGKTGLSAAELPRDKACDTGDNGYDFTRYIVGGEFIFSCYINSKKPDQSMYSLSYFENGSIVDEVYGLQKISGFPEKIREISGDCKAAQAQLVCRRAHCPEPMLIGLRSDI